MSMKLIPISLLDRVAHRFKLLSEPLRLQLLNQLQVNGEMCVSDLVHATGQRQANISKHLNLLAREGILKRRKEGINVHYRIIDPSIQGICLLVCSQLGDEAVNPERLKQKSAS